MSAAEARVESALRYLKAARSLTSNHVESVSAMQKQAQEMLVNIRAKARMMKEGLDALMDRSDRLLHEMMESQTQLSQKVA